MLRVRRRCRRRMEGRKLNLSFISIRSMLDLEQFRHSLIAEVIVASRGINKVILVGNVGADPETRYMPNGNAVTNLTLATSETWKDKNTGQQQERTEWHRVTFYQRLAEIVAEYVKKGSKIYVEGRLQTRSWEQDGIKRYATDIIANEMQMLDSRNSGGGQDNYSQDSYQGSPQAASHASSQQPSQNRSAPQQNAPQQRPVDDSFDDDIPF